MEIRIRKSTFYLTSDKTYLPDIKNDTDQAIIDEFMTQ